jgi:hypothetical protein
VDTAILLLDEIVKYEDKLNAPNITSVVRRAILDTPIFDDEGKMIQVALVLSTLHISPVGLTSSERDVQVIGLCESLDIDMIKRDIWRVKGDDQDDRSATVLAALTCKLPRLVESVLWILETRKYYSPDVNISFREVFADKGLDAIVSLVRTRYIGQFPSPVLFAKMIYGDTVRFSDEGVSDAIRFSIITNSIDHFKTGSEKEDPFIPDTSILMLHAVSMPLSDIKKTNKVVESICQTILVELVDSILKMCVKTSIQKHGDLLESVIQKWVNLKWWAAAEIKDATFSVAKLLGLEEFVKRNVETPLRKILETQMTPRAS